MIQLTDITIRNSPDFALTHVSFEVPAGAYGVLMGPTGCGKTSILEAICGLRPVAAGTIKLNGHDATLTPPAHRGVGYVPQDGALFSNMTVAENLAFALTVRHWHAKQIDERVNELADLLGITPLLTRMPQGLSGGETQRVALGRALAARPTILCLDEPLNALDADAHDAMCDLLRKVQQQTHVTALHVTHDAAEAKHLADKMFTLKSGAVVATA
jgi:ABC-type sugar transport system ATPase subunit